MKIYNGMCYLTIGEVAKIVRRSTVTIKYWYEWYAQQTEEIQKEFPLPEFNREIDKRKTRYLLETQLYLLQNFRDSVVYGKLALMDTQKEILSKI